MPDQDKLSSLVIAENVVNHLLDKVSHFKYMQELERKVTPYVIADTTGQALKSICAGELVYDPRIDDNLLCYQQQLLDEMEPKALGTDVMAPER